MLKNHLRSGALAAAVLGLLTTTGSAATFNWARGVGGSFAFNNSTGVTAGEVAVSGTGNWSTGNGTVAGTNFPGLAGDIANINNGTSAAQTLDLDQNVTLGQINFGNSGSGNKNNRTLASGGAGTFALTMDNTTADSLISLGTTGGAISNITITCTVRVAGDGNLGLTNTSTALLNLAGNVTSALTSGTQNITNISGNVTVSGAISDGTAGGHLAVSVTAGKLTLSGVNTYTGTTAVNGGTLQVTKKTALYNGNTAQWTAANITVASGGTLQFNVGGTGEFTSSDLDAIKNIGFGSNATLALDTTNAGGNFTYGGALADVGGNSVNLTKLGNGTLTLAGANTYSGTTTITTGTVQIATGGSLGTGAVVNNGALIFNQDGTSTVNGAISGNGTITQSGTGKTILAGSNTFTAATNITAGTLALVNSSNNIASSTAINVSSGATLDVSGVTGGFVMGSQLLTNNGTVMGPVTATAANIQGNGTYGDVTMNAGTFLAGSNTTVGTASLNNLTFAGGNTTIKFNSTGADSIMLTGATNISNANITILPLSLAIPNANYTVLTSTSPLTNITAGLFATFGRTAYTIDAAALAADKLQFDVAGSPAQLKWTGTDVSNPSLWSNAQIAANWLRTDASSGDTTHFYDLDSVSFDGTNTGPSTINISGTVSPTSIAVSAGNYSFNGGVIGGAGALTMTGGTLAINTSNTFTGGTTVNGGTLDVNTAAALGTGAITIAGGTLDNTSGGAVTLSANAAVNINGDFTFTGSNPLNLGTGNVTLGGAGTARNVTLTAGQLTMGPILTTSGIGLTKAGAGTLTMSGTTASNLGGTLTVSGGLFQIGGQDFHATGLAGSGTIENGGGTTRWLYIAEAANTTFSGILQNGSGGGNLGLFVSGNGTLTITGANTYSDQTTINGGATVVMNSPTALGATNIINMGGNFTVPSTGSLIVQTDGGDTPYNLTMGSQNTITIDSDVLTGHTGINHTLGNINMGITSVLNIIAGPNVTGGTPSITLGNISFTSGIGGGTSTLNPTTASLSFANASSTTNSAKTLDLDGTAANNTVTGVVADGTNVVSLVKSNTSQWTLMGANTFSGDTSVTGGELDIASGGSINSGNISVSSGATFKVLSGGNINNAANITSNGTVAMNNPSRTLGALNGAAGNVTLNGTALTLSTAGSYLGTIRDNGTNGSLTINAPFTAGSVQTGAINVNANLQINATSKTAALNLQGGSGAWTTGVDLTSNKLIVETTDAAKSNAISQIRDQVSAGKTQQVGIFTTATLPSNYAIAVIDNGALLVPLGSFGGVATDSDSILVGAELLGDSNIDGKVDLNDLNTVLNHLGTTTSAWTSGNFDGAATIDLNDLNDVLNNLGVSNLNASEMAAVSAAYATATPEPASLSVLGAAAVLLMRRRSGSRAR